MSRIERDRDHTALNALQDLVYVLAQLDGYSEADYRGVPEPGAHEYQIRPGNLEQWLSDLLDHMRKRHLSLSDVARQLRDTLKFEQNAGRSGLDQLGDLLRLDDSDDT